MIKWIIKLIIWIKSFFLEESEIVSSPIDPKIETITSETVDDKKQCIEDISKPEEIKPTKKKPGRKPKAKKVKQEAAK